MTKRPFSLEVAELEARLAAALEGVKSAEAELEHFTLMAPLEGVIGSLNVKIGMVSRPGTTVWGEILDLREIDVQSEVTPAQAESIVVGQPGEVTQNNSTVKLTGKVVCVGVAADAKTGKIPVIVRCENPESRVRCYVDVRVKLLPMSNSAK